MDILFAWACRRNVGKDAQETVSSGTWGGAAGPTDAGRGGGQGTVCFVMSSGVFEAS